jgi:hypothetical protein
MLFVSGTIIYDLQSLTESHAEAWVQIAGDVRSIPLPFDPTDRYAVTETEYLRTLMRGMIDHLEAQGVTFPLIKQCMEAAKTEAEQRWHQAATNLAAWPRHYPVIPLKYGVTAKDIEGVAVHAERRAGQYFGTKEAHIAHHAAQGMKTEQIARLFAMSRQGVEKILKAHRAESERRVQRLVNGFGCTEEEAKRLTQKDPDATK